MIGNIKKLFNGKKTEKRKEQNKPDVHFALFNDLLILDGVDSYYSEAADSIVTLVTSIHQFKKKQKSANELAIDIANAEIAIESLKYVCPALYELVPRHKALKITDMFEYVIEKSEEAE